MYGSFNSIVSDYSQELCRACAILIEREAAQSNVERGRNSVVPTDEYDGASRRPSIINAEPLLIANAAIIETLAPIEQSVDTFNPGETVQALAALSPAKRACAAMALERKYANAAKAYPTILARDRRLALDPDRRRTKARVLAASRAKPRAKRAQPVHVSRGSRSRDDVGGSGSGGPGSNDGGSSGGEDDAAALLRAHRAYYAKLRGDPVCIVASPFFHRGLLPKLDQPFGPLFRSISNPWRRDLAKALRRHRRGAGQYLVRDVRQTLFEWSEWTEIGDVAAYLANRRHWALCAQRTPRNGE